MSFQKASGPEYLSIDDTCRMLGVTPPTLYRWLKLGLPSHQVVPRGRRLFVREEVLHWVQSRCITPPAGQDGQGAA